MIPAMKQFMLGLRAMAWPWRVWLGGLSAVNVIGGVVYAGRPEGQATLIAMAIAMGIMLAVVQARGFVRLLGIGHILAWIPLLVWLATRLDGARDVSGLYTWILVLIAVNGVSLIIDVVDVVSYARGAREPM